MRLLSTSIQRTSTNTTLTKAKRKRLLEKGMEDVIHTFIGLKKLDRQSRRNRSLNHNHQPQHQCHHQNNPDHHHVPSNQLPPNTSSQLETNIAHDHQNISTIDPVVISSTNKKNKPTSAHMKSKEGISSENYESLEIIIKYLTSSTTQELFVDQIGKYKKGLTKDFFKRLAASLEKEGYQEKLYSAVDSILSMKKSLFLHKANILDKLKVVKTKIQLALYIQNHTVTKENLLKKKPEGPLSVILVVSHEGCFVSVGVGKVMGFVSDDDTQVQLSVSAVEINSELVFKNAEFRVGGVLNWKWNELAIDFADIHKTSASSLVNMTTLLDPKNNHVDNSDIFGPPPTMFPTITQNIIPHLSQPSQSFQPPLPTFSSPFPTSSSMTQPFGIISSFPSSAPLNSGSASSSGINTIPSFSGGTIPSIPTNNINSIFEQEKKNYEERIAKLVERDRQQVLEISNLKKLNEELAKSESEAKKRTLEVENHNNQKMRRIYEITGERL